MLNLSIFIFVGNFFIFVAAECAVTEWGQFSPCSVTCGKGLRMRQRFYVNQMKADMMGCDRQLEEKEMCAADVELCPCVEQFLTFFFF